MIVPSRRENPKPSARSLEVIDTIKTAIQPDDNELESWTTKYLANFRDRFAFDLDYAIEFFRPRSPILEVGSVPPVLTGALQESGFATIGVDIAPERFSGSLKSLGLKVDKVNIETDEWPFEDGTFEGVIFNEIFEHLRINLISTISELNRVVKLGGRVLLSTPNPHSILGHYRYFVTRETFSVGGSVFSEYAKVTNLGHMGHVREYGSTDVIEFFSAMGFETEEIIYRGGGAFAKAMPKAFRPFSTFVFRKIGPPRPTSSAGLSPRKNRSAQPWMVVLSFVLITPAIVLSWATERFLVRWLTRRMGYPVVK